MSLIFKKDAKTVYTSEPWYALVDGGYIKPDDMLEEKDAKRVKEAIKLLEQFLSEAEYMGFLEVG